MKRAEALVLVNVALTVVALSLLAFVFTFVRIEVRGGGLLDVPVFVALLVYSIATPVFTGFTWKSRNQIPSTLWRLNVLVLLCWAFVMFGGLFATLTAMSAT